MVEGVEDVVGQAGEQVDDKPRFEIVEPDDLGVGHDLAARADVGRVKVEDNVNEKNHVHDRVQHEQEHVLRGLVLQRHVVGDHDGRVEGEDEDDPVPDGLEGAVVEQDVRGRFRSLLSVLGHNDLRTEAHELKLKWTFTYCIQRTLVSRYIVPTSKKSHFTFTVKFMR